MNYLLPNPIIFSRPLNAWLGLVLLVLILLQMGIGIGWIQLPFKTWHKRILPIAILVIMLIHGYYGLQIYFFK